MQINTHFSLGFIGRGRAPHVDAPLHHFGVKLGKRSVDIVSDRKPSTEYTAELKEFIAAVETSVVKPKFIGRMR